MERLEYRIIIGIRSYWITESEREKYLSNRGKPGIDHVALRDGLLILPVICQEIVHISAIKTSQEMDRLITGSNAETAEDQEYAG